MFNNYSIKYNQEQIKCLMGTIPRGEMGTGSLLLISSSNNSVGNLLSMQHSIDYWLWADLIAPESERLLKSVVRVHRQEEADLFYIPFFTTISFFLMEKQQCKALYRV